MNTEIGIIAIAVVCALILLMGMLKKKAEILLNFVVRVVVCFIIVFFVNNLLESKGISLAVGINPVSVLTCGTLGICGVAALYGILLLQLL